MLKIDLLSVVVRFACVMLLLCTAAGCGGGSLGTGVKPFGGTSLPEIPAKRTTWEQLLGDSCQERDQGDCRCQQPPCNSDRNNRRTRSE